MCRLSLLLATRATAVFGRPKMCRGGVQSHPPAGRERRRKAGVGLWTRGLKAHDPEDMATELGIGL